MRIAVLLIALSLPVYSQSFFKIGKKVKLSGVKVERKIIVKANQRELASRVIKNSKLERTYIQPVVAPIKIVGPNRYLKGIENRFRKFPEWRGIEKSNGYNGAHHIVTKSVIKEIGGSSECIIQAPSVFHPLHNDPKFINMFHDHERQLKIYAEKGIEGIIIDFFERANEVSDRVGIPLYNDEVIYQALLEAELWAKHWGLKWN